MEALRLRHVNHNVEENGWLKDYRRKFINALDGVLLLLIVFGNLVARRRYRKPVINYPKNSIFWVTDFFVKGCRNFIIDCPAAYKSQHICARNYNQDYKDFSNYCEMQFENCNTWQNWQVFKRERC